MTSEIFIDEYTVETSEGRWLVDVTLSVQIDPGIPRWKGSIWSCPSDVDWHGQDPYVEDIDRIEVGSVAWDDVEKDDVQLAPWERRIIEEYIGENIDEELLLDRVAPDPW